jgi:hypothetical protein
VQGLGKTLEVLHLILSRRRPSRPHEGGGGGRGGQGAGWGGGGAGRGSADDVSALGSKDAVPGVKRNACDSPEHAQHVHTSLDKKPCVRPIGATLIVCPSHILDQWREEICTHADANAVKMVCYRGMLNSHTVKCGVSVEEIQSADVVLTTYDVLKRDVYFVPTERSLREPHENRQISLLLRFQWWRICLDEAQEVENSTTKAAEMALKLSTVHRWAVTGTPVHRGLQDLQGLALFLGSVPWNNKTCWQRALKTPFESGSPVAAAMVREWLREVFWRTQKEDVKHELSLPDQREVSLSPACLRSLWLSFPLPSSLTPLWFLFSFALCAHTSVCVCVCVSVCLSVCLCVWI